MKGLKIAILFISVLLLLCALPACNKEPEVETEEEFTPLPEGTLSMDERLDRSITFFVDWCDGSAVTEQISVPDSRGVHAYSDEALGNRGRTYYVYGGLYTEKDGKGQRAFDTAGVYLLRTNGIKNGDTLYACWKPIDVVICYDCSYATRTTFLDGSTKKTVRVTYDGEIPQIFPDVVCEVGEFLYWRSPSVMQISNGTALLDEQKKVASHVSGAGFSTSNGIIQSVPQSSTVYGDDPTYVLTLTPVIQYDTRTLTLNYNNGQVAKFDLAYGTNITSYLSTDDYAGRKLVGWATSPTETENFVTVGTTITADLTLYAIWKSYRTVRFHTLDGEIVEQDVYQYETHYLPAPEARNGYVFFGWYDSAELTTPASRIITYTGTTTDYYAKWRKEKISFTVEWRPSERAQTYYAYVDMNGNYPTEALIAAQPNGYAFLGVFTEANGGGTQMYDNTGAPLTDWVTEGAAYYGWYMAASKSVGVWNGMRYIYFSMYLTERAGGGYCYEGSITNPTATFPHPTYDARFMRLTGFYDTKGNMLFDADGKQLVEFLDDTYVQLEPRYEPRTVTFVYLLPEGCAFVGGATAYTEEYSYLDGVITLPNVVSTNGILSYWCNVAAPEATVGTKVSEGTRPLASANTVQEYDVQYNAKTGECTVYLLAVIAPATGGGAQ